MNFRLGKLSIRENLVMASTYVSTSVRTFRVGVSKNEFFPSPLDSFCPLLFQKPLEMIDKSESVDWPNVWWILGADHLTSEGVMVDFRENVLQTDFDRKKACNISGRKICGHVNHLASEGKNGFDTFVNVTYQQNGWLAIMMWWFPRQKFCISRLKIRR